MVFSHPNHELAVFGSIGRMRPHLIFLTDGGGADRIEQTKRGLERLGPLGSVAFLDHSEARLYQALLDGDLGCYVELGRQVRDILRRLDFQAVYCDGVEFYNPLHDIALPVVRAALQDRPPVPVFEVPLIYQTAGVAEGYEIQHVPASLEADCVWVDLSADETARKTAALDSVYRIISDQLGGEISRSVLKRARREFFLRARRDLPLPAREQVLRYDIRGKAAQASGAVARAITYAEHYAPMFRRLCAPNSLA